MSRIRHKGGNKPRAEGGAVSEVGNPHVFKLAKEGGSPGIVSGDKGKPRLDRKRGGKACS
jgi:hypothetical protein